MNTYTVYLHINDLIKIAQCCVHFYALDLKVRKQKSLPTLFGTKIRIQK